MGFLDLFRRKPEPAATRAEPSLIASGSLENPSTSLAHMEDWSWMGGGGAHTKFGPAVTAHLAMTVSTVWRCVTLRAGVAAGLPLKVYRRTATGREEASDHRYARLFRAAVYPGRPMTAFAWRELLMQHVDLWGNHFAIIRMDAAARVIGIEPVDPWRVEVIRKNGTNLYRVEHRPEDGGGVEYVQWDDMIHLTGPGHDGVVGLSRIQTFARDAVALSKVMEQQAGLVTENAARPSGIVTLPAAMNDKALARFKAQFREQYTGVSNVGRVIFGDNGTQFTRMQLSPADLNTLEARSFQIADISRFFGVPLHLLNEAEGSTSWGSGLAEQTQAFLIYTLDPDLSRIENELNYKLFDGTDYYCEFDRDALLAMDPVKASEVMQREIASGVMLVNEARRKRNRAPVEHGDTPLVNSTNVALSTAVNPPQPAAAPASPAPDAPPPAEE